MVVLYHRHQRLKRFRRRLKPYECCLSANVDVDGPKRYWSGNKLIAILILSVFYEANRPHQNLPNGAHGFHYRTFAWTFTCRPHQIGPTVCALPIAIDRKNISQNLLSHKQVAQWLVRWGFRAIQSWRSKMKVWLHILRCSDSFVQKSERLLTNHHQLRW